MQAETLTEIVSLTDEERPLPEGWRLVRLGDVCYQSRRIVEPQSDEARKLKYLSLEYIESETGKILFDTNEVLEDEGKSTTFYFNEKHILYGKLRPYLNKVALPDFEGRCTTEIIPLLPNENAVREYLALILRRSETVNAVMKETTGSRMPRADVDVLLNLKIPLPPTIEEQRQIASILDEQMKAVEQARLAVEKQLAAANLLPNAFLRSVFESEEAQKWERKNISQWVSSGFIEDIQDGNHGEIHPRASEYVKSGVPFVMANCMKANKLDLSRCNYISEERAAGLRIGFSKKGDVLLTHKGSIGLTAIVPDDLDLIVLTPQITYYRPNTDFLDASFLNLSFLQPAFQKQLMSIAKQATRDYVGITAQKDLKLSIPSLEEQKKIAERLNEQMQAVETLKKSLSEKLEAVKKLPAALLRKAFAGEI